LQRVNAQLPVQNAPRGSKLARPDSPAKTPRRRNPLQPSLEDANPALPVAWGGAAPARKDTLEAPAP